MYFRTHTVVFTLLMLGASGLMLPGRATTPSDATATLVGNNQYDISTVLSGIAAIPRSAPATGAGLDVLPANGGVEIKTESVEVTNTTGTNDTGSGDNNKKPAVTKLVLKPVSVSAADWSSSTELETWSASGLRTRSGSRFTTLFGYTRGLTTSSEFALNIPWQTINITGLQSQNGVGDTELTYRKYISNSENLSAPTYVLSGKAYLPTGDYQKGLGVGRFSYGASGTASKPFFTNTLGYLGCGYTLMGKPANTDLKNVLYYWLGANTQLSPRWTMQYELVKFNSPQNEANTRLLLGGRYLLTPTAGLQFNVKRELQADGRSTTVSIGYSSRF